MNNVFKVLRQIESTSSRNEKKRILQENVNNEDLKLFLLYTYNSRWIYGIGSKSIKKYDKLKSSPIKKSPVSQKELFMTKNTSSECNTIFELLDELKQHPHGSQTDVTTVNNFLANVDEESYYWYTRCILKDLKIGCTTKTINTVMKDLIPEFEVMLAHSYAEHCHKITESMEFQIEEKLNGYRMIAIHYPNQLVEFFTRTGLQLYKFPDIEQEFKHMSPPTTAMVYDGEAQCACSFNETQRYMMRSGEKRGVCYNVFDVMTLSEWENKISEDNFFDRFDFLQSLIPENFKFIKINRSLYRGSDKNEIDKWFKTSIKNEWEGIMIKLNTPYLRKRTWHLLKYKEMKEIDLKCTKINPGKPGSRFENTLGSITVDYKGVEVDVSGFTDEERLRYWNKPSSIIGKTVTVQYFEITKNEKNQPSLQFPQFIGVRSDK